MVTWLVLCLSVSLLCVSLKTLVIGCRLHLDRPGRLHLQILNLFTSSETLYPNKVACVGFGDQAVNYLFGGPAFNPAQDHKPFQSLGGQWARDWKQSLGEGFCAGDGEGCSEEEDEGRRLGLGEKQDCLSQPGLLRRLEHGEGCSHLISLCIPKVNFSWGCGGRYSLAG